MTGKWKPKLVQGTAKHCPKKELAEEYKEEREASMPRRSYKQRERERLIEVERGKRERKSERKRGR